MHSRGAAATGCTVGRWFCAGLVCVLVMGLAGSAVLANIDEPDLWWTNYGAKTINRAKGDGSNVETVISGLNLPLGIGVDAVGEHVYWGDNGLNVIRRADLDGSGATTIVAAPNGASGLALDVPGGKVYWASANDIFRADLNGANVEEIYDGLTFVSDVALDLVHDHVYFANPGTAPGRILRADLDGSNVVEVVDNLSFPMGVAVDGAGGKLYWLERDSKLIRRSNLDGTSPETLAQTDAVNGRDITVDPVGGKVYWTESGRIKRADLDGSNLETVFSGGPSIGGIAIPVPEPATGLCLGILAAAVLKRKRRTVSPPTTSPGDDTHRRGSCYTAPCARGCR
jgi:DNA-binding beta-propeller fold protein YncE